MDDTKKFLIVGLGNAEDKYAGTRHNIGFEVVSHLAKSLNATFTMGRYAYVAKCSFKGRSLVLIMPTTYMNLSGNAVRFWLAQEKIEPSNMLVISDDLDLAVGELRLKPKGGGGSHNGLNHIIETIGHSNFPRLRFGIGKNYAYGYQAEYVLGKFSSEEMKTVEPSIAEGSELIKSFVTIGIEKTMNCFNTKTNQARKEKQEQQPKSEEK
ncbi:MAG: aminoacyl-tRNA hydrolase [Bacteroidales bacterium]|nr:aminoacyl-tRNA hydrolase [Bacteroidales bacterium]